MNLRNINPLFSFLMTFIIIAFHQQPGEAETKEEGIRSLSIIYTSELRGTIEPCGWKGKRRGGLARKATYLKALSSTKKIFLVLDSGNLLFNRNPRSESEKIQKKLKSDLIVKAYNEMGCTALNLGRLDLACGLDYLKKKEKEAKFPFISANKIFPFWHICFPFYWNT